MEIQRRHMLPPHSFASTVNAFPTEPPPSQYRSSPAFISSPGTSRIEKLIEHAGPSTYRPISPTEPPPSQYCSSSNFISNPATSQQRTASPSAISKRRRLSPSTLPSRIQTLSMATITVYDSDDSGDEQQQEDQIQQQEEEMQEVLVQQPQVLVDNVQQPQDNQQQPPPPPLQLNDCSICLDRIQVPSALTCGHIFCRECIVTARSYNYWCPMCRKECLLTVDLIFN